MDIYSELQEEGNEEYWPGMDFWRGISVAGINQKKKKRRFKQKVRASEKKIQMKHYFQERLEKRISELGNRRRKRWSGVNLH